MAISTEINKQLVQDVFRTYNDAESIMLEKVMKRVKRGVQQEGWTEIKYNDMVSLRQDLERTLLRTEELTNGKIHDSIIKAYQQGVNSANLDYNELPQILKDIKIPANIQRLVLEQQNLVKGTHFNILRTTEDAYRDIIGEASRGTGLGVETRKQAAQHALNRFADKGIGQFVDKAGRVWQLASYVEMATRTTIAKAAIQGHIDRQVEIGRDLVMISDHDNECPICRPWENAVLSISGNDPNYPSLQSAIDAGLFHPNCKHTLTGYIPGLSKVVKKTPAQNERDQQGYLDTQEQRYNERMIRKWKKREQVALTDQAQFASAGKVKQWQSKQRDLINRNPELRRKYDRESIRNRQGIKGVEKSIPKIIKPPVTPIAPTPVKHVLSTDPEYPDKKWKYSKQFKEEFPGINVETDGMNDFQASLVYKALNDINDVDPSILRNASLKKIALSDSGTLGADTYAGYFHKSQSIYIHKENMGSYDTLKRSYASDVASKFHPQNTDYTSLMIHEIGHSVDDGYKYSLVNEGIGNLSKNKAISSTELKKSISKYATENDKETFAEAFAQYIQNPNNDSLAGTKLIKSTKMFK